MIPASTKLNPVSFGGSSCNALLCELTERKIEKGKRRCKETLTHLKALDEIIRCYQFSGLFNDLPFCVSLISLTLSQCLFPCQSVCGVFLCLPVCLSICLSSINPPKLIHLSFHPSWIYLRVTLVLGLRGTI